MTSWSWSHKFGKGQYIIYRPVYAIRKKKQSDQVDEIIDYAETLPFHKISAPGN